MNIKDILRSINIIYDADNINRIVHFQPTTKAIVLLESLLGLRKDKAYFISAPYGSGKSITSTYLLHSIENREESKKVLNDLHSRIEKVSPQLSKVLTDRTKSNNKGLVLALQGYKENLPLSLLDALKDCLERHNLDTEVAKTKRKAPNIDFVLDIIQEFLITNKEFTHVSIIWDEFGRHIEGLIENNQQSKLNQLQTLAEFSSRSETPFTIGLLLHQGLMNYAGKTPQSVKREWKKIEGRYETIQYIDDSKEIYNLIASVVSELKPDSYEEKDFSNLISVFHNNKIFQEFSEEDLQKLLNRAQPLTPAALYILPKLSSRIAQHERTLFTFLNSKDFSNIVNTGDLYDYFSDAMSKDTAVGGVFHQWSITESALSKTDDELSEEILKTLSLLNISTAIDKGRVSLPLLNSAVSSIDTENRVNELLNKKLLLHRKNTDSVTIWHGTEIDILGILTDTKDRISGSFDVMEYIEEQFDPIHWRPIEYNNKFKIHRYFRSEYIGFEKLKKILPEALNPEKPLDNNDGEMFFFLPSTDDELKKGLKLIKERGSHPQVIWATPQQKLDIFDIALEVAAYSEMLLDAQLVDSDPYIENEINQLLDDSMTYLQKVMELSTYPSDKGPNFIYQGQKHKIKSAKSLRSLLTDITSTIFNKTPILNNEMIVKQNLRSTLINGRKKLLFAIADNTGANNLNLSGFTPDVSMFRSLLLNSGLYRQVGDGEGVDTWKFVEPSDIKDEGLRYIWSKFQNFLTDPGENKQFSTLFNELKAPPYGIRNGVIPILLQSALRAFPSVISITHIKSGYLKDILPTDIESICNTPDEYLLSVEALNDTRTELLNKLYSLFAPNQEISSREMDLIRKTYDAVELWKSNLPEASMVSRRISNDAKIFQELIRQIKNPRDVFFKKIPAKFNSTDINHLYKKVEESKKELEGITDAYYVMAGKSVLNAIQMPSYSQNQINHAIGLWTSYLPNEMLSKFKDSIAKALLVRLRMQYDSDKLLIDSIAGLLIGKPVKKWDDSTITVFEREFQENVHRIEDFVLGNMTEKKKSNAHLNLANLAVTRIDSLYRKIVDLLGDEESARELINKKIGGE